MGKNFKRMTDRDRFFRVYEQLVYEEHDAGKRIGFDKTDPENIYLDGYLDALGKALDLLGPVLGLGVKWSEDGKLILPGGENDT